MGYSPWGHKEWDMTEQLSIYMFYLFRANIQSTEYFLFFLHPFRVHCWAVTVANGLMLVEIVHSLFIVTILWNFLTSSLKAGLLLGTTYFLLNPR